MGNRVATQLEDGNFRLNTGVDFRLVGSRILMIEIPGTSPH